MRALALDLGGTHIGCGVVEEDRLLAHTSLEAEGASSLADLLPAVQMRYTRCCERRGLRRSSVRA